MKFCSKCGHEVTLTIPQGDNRERFVCNSKPCATIHYQNPRIITGCLPIYEDKILLCRRAIEPRYGLWTLPAGFMENGESTTEGAIRESWEEAKASLTIEQLYAIYDLPHINQVYFFYKAELNNLDFGAGEESLDVKLFHESEIPWEQLAFKVVTKALKHYFSHKDSGFFPLHQETILPSLPSKSEV